MQSSLALTSAMASTQHRPALHRRSAADPNPHFDGDVWPHAVLCKPCDHVAAAHGARSFSRHGCTSSHRPECRPERTARLISAAAPVRCDDDGGSSEPAAPVRVRRSIGASELPNGRAACDGFADVQTRRIAAAFSRASCTHHAQRCDDPSRSPSRRALRTAAACVCPRCRAADPRRAVDAHQCLENVRDGGAGRAVRAPTWLPRRDRSG